MGDKKLFGTDGVRGVANREPMTVEMAVSLGRAAAQVLRERRNGDRPRVVIGRDTRRSGDMIESALTAGLCSVGADVMPAGVLPTPGVAVLVRDRQADAGFVISASHNPYPDNGIKIFSADGFKLPDAEEADIERRMAGDGAAEPLPTGDGIGRAVRLDDAVERYVDFCLGTFPAGRDLKGLRIVLDCANGATWQAAPAVFERLGARVSTLHAAPDGLNINADCGSQHTESLRAAVQAQQADIGLAFDGDGDRLIVVDETGAELTGDHILAVCAQDLKERGELAHNLAVGTVMSNFGLHAAMRGLGIELACSAVGDRYVLETMKARGGVIGAESSGHMIFLGAQTTGDGIVAALQLLAVMQRTGKTMSALAAVLKLAPQRLINVDVARRPPLESLEGVQAAVAAAERELGDEGRVLVRYSGTQLMCRVMVEGPTMDLTGRLCESIAAAVKDEIG